MPTVGPADDAAIREQAYYFWEQDGRPEGREAEYWMRASVAVAGKGQLDTLAKPAREKASKPRAVAKPKVAAKPAPKLKAAASKSKATPVKAQPVKKPKKK